MALRNFLWQYADSPKHPYQEALGKSGYHYDLSYKVTPSQTRHRTRQRNIIWYNPPYSRSVATTVGKCFPSLIDHHFPKSNPLHKNFNHNTMKLSYMYSCMNNVKSIISSHSKSIIRKSTNSDKDKKNCNCRKPEKCPMDGNCNVESIIYQAEVTSQTTREIYIGLCDTS